MSRTSASLSILPTMNRDREVRFLNTKQFLAEYDRYLRQGGVYVQGDSLPDPLEFIELRLILPDPPGGSVALSGEVTSSVAQRALIRFVSFGNRERGVIKEASDQLKQGEKLVDDTDAVRRRLREEVDRMSRANYFDRLGVHWADHATLIEERYQMVEGVFGRGTVRYLADSQTAEHIRELMAEAYKTLIDPGLRDRYRRTVVGESKMQRAAVFIAEKCANDSVKRGSQEKARRWLEVAMELHASPEIVAQFDAFFGRSASKPRDFEQDSGGTD